MVKAGLVFDYLYHITLETCDKTLTTHWTREMDLPSTLLTVSTSLQNILSYLSIPREYTPVAMVITNVIATVGALKVL